ncbi:MAG TPA: type II secretion system F family protein [Mycobacteriales bacterium]|jgi:tight adherence protein B|nr:type II secretion system F family protein [Mycobacteriales bacterium]
MRARAWLAAPLAALAVATAAVPAWAAGGRITQIDADHGTVKLVFSAGSLPDGVTVDPASVHVTVDGNAVEATAERLTGEAVERRAELVIDTSGSMKGEGITGAKTAGLAFLSAVPKDVRVGLVTFSDRAVVRVPPTTDREALRRAIAALQPAGETSLYDGVLLGLRELGKAGARSALVLSDGGDTRSRATLATVLATAKASGATVDTVAFQTAETAPVLGRIAQAGSGRLVAAARAGDVGAAFRATARALSNQLVVTATLPDTVVGPVTIAVSARAGSADLTDEALATVPAAPVTEGPPTAPPVSTDAGAFGSRTVLWIALGALFAGLLVMFALAFGSVGGDRQSGRMRRRLSLYTLTGRAAKEAPEPTALGDSGVARSAVELAGRVVRQRDLESRLARALERGGSALKPAEWLLIHAGATFGLALLFLLLTGGRALPTLCGLILGFALPYLYLKLKASRRGNAFMTQMPDTMQLLAGSLSAGYSLPQAIDAVVREGSQPIAGEFSRAIIESRLGVPIEDALDNIAARMDSKDFAWVVMAIRIQREVGGNLAEVLTTVANTMRERERVRRQVRVLSAEGRLSAWVLGGLPPIFALYLVLVRPEYIKPLFTTELGLAMIGTGALLFVAGVFWLRKVVKVEV